MKIRVSGCVSPFCVEAGQSRARVGVCGLGFRAHGVLSGLLDGCTGCKIAVFEVKDMDLQGWDVGFRSGG